MQSEDQQMQQRAGWVGSRPGRPAYRSPGEMGAILGGFFGGIVGFVLIILLIALIWNRFWGKGCWDWRKAKVGSECIKMG